MFAVFANEQSITRERFNEDSVQPNMRIQEHLVSTHWEDNIQIYLA